MANADTLIVAPTDSLQIFLRDTLIVAHEKSAGLTTSDWINVALAAITLLAVLVALHIANRDRRDRLRESKDTENKRRVERLLGIHQHLVICSKRIREYWDMAKDGNLPSFRLPQLDYSEIVGVAPTIMSNTTKVQLLIKATEEHIHLNDKFNDLEDACHQRDEMKASSLLSQGVASVSSSMSRLSVSMAADSRVDGAQNTLLSATPVVYLRNRECMVAIEEQEIGGKKLKDIVTLVEGSHSEPLELDKLTPD